MTDQPCRLRTHVLYTLLGVVTLAVPFVLRPTHGGFIGSALGLAAIAAGAWLLVTEGSATYAHLTGATEEAEEVPSQ